MSQDELNDSLIKSVKNGDLSGVKDALSKGANVMTLDDDGWCALHHAAYKGHTDITEVLLSHNADINVVTTEEGFTPLILAAKEGHKNIVLFLTQKGANLDLVNKNGKTALFVATEKNHTDIVLFLIESGCSVDVKDEDNDSALHWAAYNNNVDIIRVLLDHTIHIDVKNQSGNTPLHDACSQGSVDTIKVLLSSGRVDPISKNNDEQAPMELVPHHHKNRFEILKMFEPFQQSQADFPVESYGKVFMCGSIASGKSSLAAVIMERAKKPADYKFDISKCVTVEPLTAGINVHTFTSHEIGNVVLYDLAGHREYYSSHAAVLENLMLSSPAVFLVLSKLINDRETMRKDLFYWFNFLENVSKGMKSSNRSQIIVIGSRLDELTTALDPISGLVHEVAEKAIYSQEFCGFIPMECHRPGGKGVKEFIFTLSKSCKTVLDRANKISIYCHVQYSFLQLLQRVAINLEELCALLKERNDPSLPSEMSVLLELLTSLSDKGLILFLRNEEGQSWIVINKTALLSEINGVLFAPAAIQHVYRDIASNTGVVPLSALKEVFPHYNTDMLVGFLRSLQFCHVIESGTLGDLDTNISASIPLPLDEVLFFPALISAERPTDIKIENGLGWCLWCPDPNEFLSTRFLHILLLSLAYIYCLSLRRKPGIANVANPTIQRLSRRCTLWTNGIYWKSRFEVFVEVSEYNRCVTVLTSNKEMEESHQVFNSIIRKVLSLKKQLCSCTSDEYLIAPDQVSTAHTIDVYERTLFSMEDVAFAVLTKAKVIDTDGITFDVKEIVGNRDPFLCIAPLVTKALFNTRNAELPVQDDYLQHILDVCGDIFLSSVECTHVAIKEHCSCLSVFAGRNPLDLASPLLTDDDIKHASKSLGTSDDTTDSSYLNVLLDKEPKKVHLQRVLGPIQHKWREIGEALEIPTGIILSIEHDAHYDDSNKLSEVLQTWIDTKRSDVTWRNLIDVITEYPINEPVLAKTIPDFLANPKVSSKYDIGPSNDITDSSHLENTPVENVLDIDQILSKVPKRKDVLALLMPIKEKWYLIGVSLEVNTGELESLKISNNSSEMNLSIVINKWLEEKSNEATWKALLKELDGPIVNNCQIGDNIRTFLKRSDVYNKYVFAIHNPLELAPPSLTKDDIEHASKSLVEKMHQNQQEDFVKAAEAQKIDSQHLRKAIKKSGKVKAKVSKVLVQGPARVGKTSVKSLILSKLYTSTVSTGIAERPQVAVGDFSMEQFGQSQEKKWELVTDNNLIEIFANDIKSLIERDDARKKELEYSKKTQDVSHLNSRREKTDHHIDIDFNYSVYQNEEDNIDQEEDSRNAEEAQHKSVEGPVPNITTNMSPDPKQDPGLQSTEESANNATAHRDSASKQLSEILSVASTRTDKLTLYKDWLYFIDSGGQIQFQQILQAFIPCASVLMLVISLADELSTQSSSELQCSDGKTYLVSEHSLSIKTLLKRLISMVNFSNQQEHLTSGDKHLTAAIKPPDKLKVITVATHRDKLKQKGETIEEKEAQLKQIFQSVEGNLSYEDPVSGKILSEVDGRKASVPEDEHDENLRKVIEGIHSELRKQAFEVNIPLSWYAYEILLRKKASDSCGVLPLEECISYGIDLGLEKGEIQSALKFLYLLNCILYYPKNVTNLVFIDPYSLVQVVNELMVLTCKIRRGVNVGRGPCALPKMAKFGIISSDVFSLEDHLEMFTKVSQKFVDFKSHLFSIFTHLLIAKKLPGRKSTDDNYFMPALLPLTDPLKENLFEFSNSNPLLFYFKNGVPVGLFCAMIVNLLSSEDYITDDGGDDDGLYSDFLWELDESTSKMYSNALILQNYDLRGRVGLVESSDWFEIHCERHEDQAEVKEAIENAINETKRKRNIGEGMKLEIAFFCPCGDQPRHLAILKQKNFVLYCKLHHGGRVEDTQGFAHMSWITSLKSNPGKRPELRHLVRLLAPVSCEWYLIGVALGVDSNTIKCLNESNESKETKLVKILQKWTEMKSTPVTWENIINVVRGPVVQQPNVAISIQQSLKEIRNEYRRAKRQSNCTGDHKQVITGNDYTNEMSNFAKLFEKPTRLDILKRLVCIDSSWRGIGYDLGVSYNALQSLSQSNLPDQTKLDIVLQKWIEMDGEATPVTWKMILDVIKGPLVQNNELAMEIYKSLRQESTRQQKATGCQESSLDIGAAKTENITVINSQTVTSSKYKALTVDTAFDLLDHCGFKVSFWNLLARRLRVPYEKRNEIETKINEQYNLESALEESLDCWIKKHTGQPEWKELVDAVEKCGDKDAAIKMKEVLQL